MVELFKNFPWKYSSRERMMSTIDLLYLNSLFQLIASDKLLQNSQFNRRSSVFSHPVLPVFPAYHSVSFTRLGRSGFWMSPCVLKVLSTIHCLGGLMQCGICQEVILRRSLCKILCPRFLLYTKDQGLHCKPRKADEAQSLTKILPWVLLGSPTFPLCHQLKSIYKYQQLSFL